MYTRRNTNRILRHDYSEPGQYYVTICTENRQEMFGAIENDQMDLNDAGKMVDQWWQEIYRKYNNLSMDEYVIMPNHIHGIINIVGARFPRPILVSLSGRGDPAPTIGNIIAYYKYQTTKQINESENKPGRRIWQRNYYDHVIRNEYSLNKIREYIRNNHSSWQYDNENKNKIDNVKLNEIIV